MFKHKKLIKENESSLNSISSAIKTIKDNNIIASAQAGEMTFIQSVSTVSTGNILPNTDLMPAKYILQSLKRLLTNMKGLIRDKKKRKPAVIITLIWTIIMFLGSDSLLSNVVNFLTFSKGGTSGGLIGVVGGSIGKGVFAYFITTLIMPLLKGKKSLAFLKDGFIVSIKMVGNKKIKTKAHAFLGMGLALITYNFLSSDASLSNSMIGIASFIMCIRMLSKKAGFLRGLIMSFIRKYSKSKKVKKLTINKIISGFALGFALSVALSTTGINIIAYLVGAVFLVVSFIMKSFSKDTEKPNKGATI